MTPQAPNLCTLWQGVKWSEVLTVLAERPPRNPDCLAAGGSGLRQAAHMPRCSFTRSASASRGGSSVSSLTRLPYLQRTADISPMHRSYWLRSTAHACLL